MNWRFFRLLKYEGYLVRKAWQLFGWNKTIRLTAGLPLVFFTKKNRSAFEFMGPCKMSIDGKQIVFMHPDVRFIDEIITKKCYTPNSDFEISPEEVIVDAGANIGIFTVYASVLATKGKVFAIEPETENFEFLNDNVRINNLANVVTVNAALSDKTGYTNLYLGNPGNNSIIESFARAGHSEVQTCQSTTINNFIERYSIHQIDLMKVDIEGAEFLLFGDSTWLQHTRRIVLEVHPLSGNLTDLISALRMNGFETTTSVAYDKDALYLFARKSRTETDHVP